MPKSSLLFQKNMLLNSLKAYMVCLWFSQANPIASSIAIVVTLTTTDTEDTPAATRCAVSALSLKLPPFSPIYHPLYYPSRKPNSPMWLDHCPQIIIATEVRDIILTPPTEAPYSYQVKGGPDHTDSWFKPPKASEAAERSSEG